MAKSVDPQSFFDDCRAALRADPNFVEALSQRRLTNTAKSAAARQGFQSLVPIFERYLRLDNAATGVVRRTLCSISGADQLRLKRSGPGFLIAGCVVLLVANFAGGWAWVLGATLATVGVIQLATTKPVPQALVVDFNVLEALATATPSSSTETDRPMHDNFSHVDRAQSLESLNALIATTSRREAGPVWIAFDAPYRFGALTLPRGGFYVGPLSGNAHHPDCAIDPRLEFTLAKPDWLGKGIPYWPRYAALSPEERGTFLAFLHSARRAGGVAIGYVFLYVYGLEHRLVRDTENGGVSSEEGRVLIDELLGILQAYGAKSASIGRYVGELLAVAFARFPQHVPSTPVPGIDWNSAQRIAFASAAERAPLSSDWAFAWASSFHASLRNPSWQAMLQVVRELFTQRYATSPLATRALKKSRKKLVLNYRWAAFSGSRVEPIAAQCLDYSGADAQAIPYQALLQSVCEDLDAMRRAQRNESPFGATLAAAPAEIAHHSISPVLTQWATTELNAIRAQGTSSRPLPAVAAALGWIGSIKIGKREVTQIAQALQVLGIGMEPDPRFGGATPKPNDDLTLFELSNEAARAPSAAYAAAHLMVTAAASLGGVDGHTSTELGTALTGITAHFQLRPSEHARLKAVLASQVGKPVRATAVANKVKGLPEAQRHALAAVLVDIALADGQVSPAEIKLLERFYGALGLDPATLHADLHHGSLGAKKPTATAVAVTGAPTPTPAFDAEAIAQKLEETARVQSMLAEIFVEDTPASASAAPSPPSVSDDQVHHDVLQLIAGRDTLDRADWEAYCEALDLMPDAALEALNEWALERTGETLLDGDDLLDVNAYVRDQLAPTTPESRPA